MNEKRWSNLLDLTIFLLYTLLSGQLLSDGAGSYADQITTPLLILHNDADEAVSYEQGRGLFLALHRLQKPAWLVNYKGEGHFLSNPSAQYDWTIRMQQFFDYYLKDTPPPDWMKEGLNKD